MNPTNPAPPAARPGDERYWNRFRLAQTFLGMAIFWAAVAAIALIMGAAGTLRAGSQQAWPAAPGTIVAAAVEPATIPGPATRRADVVAIEYEYGVGGVVYRGRQIDLNPVLVEADSEEGRRRLATYPPGAAVTVYYDPTDPANALLERGSSSEGFRAGLFGLAIAAAAGLLALWVRPR